MNVFPNFDGLSGVGDLKTVIGAALTIVLIIAVLIEKRKNRSRKE
jgi:hypothetical protein